MKGRKGWSFTMGTNLGKLLSFTRLDIQAATSCMYEGHLRVWGERADRVWRQAGTVLTLGSKPFLFARSMTRSVPHPGNRLYQATQGVCRRGGWCEGFQGLALDHSGHTGGDHSCGFEGQKG